MASSTHTAASIIQSDEVPCCGCFGQASPRAKPRPSSPHLQSVCRPQAPKAKEPEQIGGWTIGAELSGGCDSTHPTGNTPQQLHRLPSGAEELHERTQILDDVSPVHTPNATPDQHDLSASSALHEPDSATASAFLLTSTPQIPSSHQSNSRSLLQSGTAAADTNASFAASQSTSNAVQSASASTGTCVKTATHTDIDSQAEAHAQKTEGARDTMSGSHLPPASVSDAAGRSQLSVNLPMESVAQLDLDLPAQLAEPESQEAGPAVASDVVRGRMVRATENWHRQLACQEGYQFSLQLATQLAQLRGQNQKEQLALPLLHLAGAVQAALVWQQKVGQYTVAAPLSHYHPSPNPPQPMGRGAARRGASGGLQRAVSHLESHLKATRQDALQLATAVVRLEKEKAALQNSLKQQSAHGLQQTWPSRTGPSSQGQLHRSATSPAASSHAAVQGQHSHQKPITADGTQEVNRAAVDSSQHSDQHEQTHQHGWDHEQHCVQAMHPAHEQQGSQPHEQTLHQMQAQQESQQHPDLQQRQQDQQHEQQEGLVHEHTQHQHTQYEQAQHEQHPQASQSLGGGNKSPTRRASGYAGRLGFGSSSHSRIEDNAQHANASSRSSSAHTSGMQPHRHSMQPQTDTMQPVPQPDVGQSVQQSNEDQKPHKLERTVHNAESDCDVASGQAPHSAASTTSNATCAAQQDSPLHLVHPDALQQHSSAQPGNLQSHDTDSHSRLLQGDMDVPTCTQAVEQSHANTAPQVSSLQLEQHADVRWESALQTLNHRRLQCDGPRGTFGQGTDHPALGRTTSLQEQAGATSPSATPSFMRPTVSSLVHSTSRQRSLRKSQSEHMI